MATDTLQGKKVAILVTDGFEQVGIAGTAKGARRSGRDRRKVVSPAGKKVKGWNHKEWGNEVPVDIPLELCESRKNSTRCCCPAE